ncbi:MAG: hypothetical protein IJ272_10185 [Clostridia bacterium]|nr:hypothetical protein [Clostridia bacterium]
MKNVNWSLTRKVISYGCLITFMVFGYFSILLFLIYEYDKFEPAKAFGFIGLVLTIFSVLIGSVTCIIDYVCKHKESKKSKKLECVQPQVIIKENIVV